MLNYLSIKIEKVFEVLRKNWALLAILIIYSLLITSVFWILPNSMLIRVSAIVSLLVIFLVLSSYVRKNEARKEEELENKIHSETLVMFPDLQGYFDKKQWNKVDELVESENTSDENKIRIKKCQSHYLLSAIFGEWQSINERFSNEKIEEVLTRFNIENRSDAFKIIQDPNINLTEDELEILNMYYNTNM